MVLMEGAKLSAQCCSEELFECICLFSTAMITCSSSIQGIYVGGSIHKVL